MLEYIYGRMKKHSIYLAQVNILFMYFVMNLLECSKKLRDGLFKKRYGLSTNPSSKSVHFVAKN